MRVSNMTVYRLIKSGELRRGARGQELPHPRGPSSSASSRTARSAWRKARWRRGASGSTSAPPPCARPSSPAATRRPWSSAAQVPLPAGAVENGEVREPELVAEALRELWQRGGFKVRQVYLGVGNQRVVVREIALPVPAREGAAGLARVPGAGVHPDAGGRGRPGLRPDRGVRAGGPPDAADAPGGRAARHGRHARRVRARRAKLEPVGLDLVPVRHGALGRHAGVGHGSRGRGRGGHHRHRRPRHEHRRARARRHAVRPHPAVGRPRHHARRSRARAGHRGRRGGTPEARRGGRASPRTSTSERVEARRRRRVRQLAMQRAASFVDEIRSSLEFYTAQAQGARIARVLITGGGSKLEASWSCCASASRCEVEPARCSSARASQLSLSPRRSPRPSRCWPSRSASRSPGGDT